MYKKKISLIIAFLVVIISLLNIKDFYTKISIPVEGAKPIINWDEKSFWYYPWGESDIHRGIDIFGDLDAPILSPVTGIVIKSGTSANGGNYIYILSYDLKTYYFAHLNKRLVKTFSLVDEKKYNWFNGRHRECKV